MHLATSNGTIKTPLFKLLLYVSCTEISAEKCEQMRYFSVSYIEAGNEGLSKSTSRRGPGRHFFIKNDAFAVDPPR